MLGRTGHRGSGRGAGKWLATACGIYMLDRTWGSGLDGSVSQQVGESCVVRPSPAGRNMGFRAGPMCSPQWWEVGPPQPGQFCLVLVSGRVRLVE